MGYHVAAGDRHDYEERPSAAGAARRAADLTASLELKDSRARIWRFPGGSRGRRHIDVKQEEVFVVLEGVMTFLLGEPPERFDVGPHGVVAVDRGTERQLRNETEHEAVVFAYGAPPETGGGQLLDDVDLPA